jgi:thiol-disulfide isomerase/thioredoxin
MSKPVWTGFALVVGLLLGLATYHGALVLTGQTAVPREFLDEQQARLEGLEQENLELAEELFAPARRGPSVFSGDDSPYDEVADGALVVNDARATARADGKFLMVTFGANWCVDCRTLHHHLNSEPVLDYTKEVFDFAFVDVGKFNRNREVVTSLGVSLSRGIPVAIIFDQDGDILGTTNEGQLEPARLYSSQQILKFVRDVAERSRIQAPD